MDGAGVGPLQGGESEGTMTPGERLGWNEIVKIVQFRKDDDGRPMQSCNVMIRDRRNVITAMNLYIEKLERENAELKAEIKRLRPEV